MIKNISLIFLVLVVIMMSVKMYRQQSSTTPDPPKKEVRTQADKIKELERQLAIKGMFEENDRLEQQNKELLEKIEKDKPRIFKMIKTSEMLQMGAIISDNLKQIEKNNNRLSELGAFSSSGMDR